MLPRAQLVADLFHVVHLAVKMTGDVRRRVVRGKHGRRGRSGDPEYGVTGLLVRNLEHLSPEQFAKVTDALGRDPAGQEIAAARFGKEKLRHALNPPASPARSCASATSAAGSLPPTTGARRTTTSPSCCPWPGRYPGRQTKSSPRS